MKAPPRMPDRRPAPPDDALLDTLPAAELQALRWSVRVGEGLSDAAQAEFQDWLCASPAHRAAYDEMAAVLQAVDELPPAGTARLRTTLAIASAQQSSARDLAQAAPRGPRRVLARRLLPHALAAVLALAVLGGGWAGWDRWQRQPVFSQQFATQRGQQLEAALPDGSRVQMDTATRAHVTLYRQRREVVLPEGQAVFQVRGDPARPFDVLAGAARITAVGTRFSVRYTPSLGTGAVQVEVMEGRVRVAPAAGDGAAVELMPGHAVSADAQGRVGAVAAVAAQAMAPWLTQRLSFDSAALSQVLAELGRYADLPVRIADPDVGALPVTASVDLRNIASFVRSLPHVLPVRLHQQGGTTEIAARPG